MRIFFLSAIILLGSCGNESPTISDFQLYSNYHFDTDTLIMEMDLSGGPFKGISLPSDTASAHRKYFHFTFTIKNETSKNQSFFYKLYYQNCSYKHAEFVNDQYNKAAANNFFGSWAGDSIPIVKWTPEIPAGEEFVVKDSIRIIGNPFDEEEYFGSDPRDKKFGEKEIRSMIAYIESEQDWYESIKKKAEVQNMKFDEQLRNDAIWQLRNKKSDTLINLRYRNNPRVGLYESILIAGPESYFEEIPEYVLNQKISDPEYGVRLNPFYWFMRDSLPEYLSVTRSKRYLRTFAVLKPSRGLYYDDLDFPEERGQSGNCSTDLSAYRYAHFKQFINSPELDSSLHNINRAHDVVGDNLSREEFAKNAEFSARNIPSYISQPKVPCDNAKMDADGEAILVVNPGNERQPYRKENGGIEGRFGFKYGKYRAKISFPEILSSHGVWNGVTCAFWLKFFSLENWNRRSVCETGYVESHPREGKRSRSPENSYSEIDIEIVKAAQYWPPSSYGESADTIDFDEPLVKDNVIFACTNWDLACQDPSNPVIGATCFEHGKDSYVMHRWDHWYRAITSKIPRQHGQTVGKPIWYEIEWSPTEIIWRIGKNSEALERVCYMDSSITTIPDNVMNPVVSQEFHYGHWWPTTPFPQGDIPYPKEPITGKVFEIRIE